MTYVTQCHTLFIFKKECQGVFYFEVPRLKGFRACCNSYRKSGRGKGVREWEGRRERDCGRKGEEGEREGVVNNTLVT